MHEVGDEPDGTKDIHKEESLGQEAESADQTEERSEGEQLEEEEVLTNQCVDVEKTTDEKNLHCEGGEFEEGLEQAEDVAVQETGYQEIEKSAAVNQVDEPIQCADEVDQTVEEEAVPLVKEMDESVSGGLLESEGDIRENATQVEKEAVSLEETSVTENVNQLQKNSEEMEDVGTENFESCGGEGGQDVQTETLEENQAIGQGWEGVAEKGIEQETVGAETAEADPNQIAEAEDGEALNQTDPVDDQHKLNGVEQESYTEQEYSMEVDESGHTEHLPESALNGDEEKMEEEDIDMDDVPSDAKSLPQCRLKRNYSCMHCGFSTQNPREHLYHLRDEHGEKMKVFECPRCIYASKNHQKLIRHARMVHKVKIKSKEGSTGSSPSKSSKHSKSPKAKVSPSKSRESVSPSKSSRSSPSKSPRSHDGTDGWDEEEEEEDFVDDDSPVKDGDRKSYNCEQCEFVCHSRKLLNKHETTFHLKRRFFRCVKCNYVTHLKGRYTKHMKYHQLPILKCEYCDFRTPYRWNLDRHMKNHTEDAGEYKCHLCNFAAQIKQSLTVHISNHHLTPEQIRDRELKRTIGVSDPADCTSDDQELEMMRLERDEHPDALRLPGIDYQPDSPSGHDSHHNGNSFRVSNIDMGGTEDSLVNADDLKDEDGEPKPKKPKIKITLKKMKEPKPQKDTFFQELNERHNFEEDFIHPDDVVHRHGNVYIKTFKCHYCSFKAAFKNEVSRHEKKIHSVPMPKSDNTYSKKNKKASKSSKSPKERTDTIQQILQYPQMPEEYDKKSSRESSGRSTPVERRDSSEFRGKVLTRSTSYSNDHSSNQRSMDDSDSHTASSKESSPSKEVGKKKNSSSFFDKLQEKISTSNVQNLVCQFCGHESKCLSESVRHQKLHLSAKNVCASPSLSTRCQFCRHRCKTTDDLVNHLKMCPEARKNQIMDSGKRISGSRQDGDDDEASESYMEDETEASPDNEESTNDDSKDGNNRKPPEKDKLHHPMENRVFVWNKIKSQEEGGKVKTPAAEETKHKVEEEESEEEDQDSKSDIPSKESSKSPIMMDYVVDFIESPTPQGHYRYSKRVFRCPQCNFWATTASRFHVHVVGHYNKKPYSCSECGYKSNWRWDITKHIKLKTTRDNSHKNAEVVITDATGEKNYEKYDRYQTIIQVEEGSAHRTEGGVPNKKGRPKRTPEKDEEPEPETPSTSPVRKPLSTSPVRKPQSTSPVRKPPSTSPVRKPQSTSPVRKPASTSPVRKPQSASPERKPPTTSPVRKPPMVAIPMIPRLPGLPRLTRAPGAAAVTRPGPMPFGPILPGPQMMVQLAAKAVASAGKVAVTTTTSSTSPKFPPPLSLRGTNPPKATSSVTAPAVGAAASGGGAVAPSTSGASNKLELNNNSGPPVSAQYQIITPQGALNTNLETLQLLASGSTNLSRLKRLQKDCVVRPQEKKTHNPNSHQMRFLAWLSFLAEGAQHKVSVSSTGEDGREVAKMVLDHEGNPEWKCNTCDFRDSERETVVQHVRLAHERGGPVSLLHAVHRCDVCGYAAGTKRAVQMHIDTSHGGQGGITSRCEGQTPAPKDTSGEGETSEHHESPRMMKCRICPYSCKKRSEMRAHIVYHTARPDCIFKCMFCPYYVPSKLELFEHLSLHGMEVPASVMEASRNGSASASPALPTQDDGSRQFLCGACPFETRSRSKLMHHRQFHKPKGLPFKCPHCSYNVTRRHLLSQHIRVHGVDPGPEEGLETADNATDDRSNSPSPSLTITPVNNVATVGEKGQESTFTDASALPKLMDQTTRLLEDIPLVWVSRDNRFFKMFKCRHCPHVNLRKTNIQEHEKMHKSDASRESGGLHCPHCSYISVNAGVMSAHIKVHGGSMGQCHAIVDPALSDEDQLKLLTSKAKPFSPAPSLPSTSPIKEETLPSNTDEKLLHFCQQCPARFFLEKEIQIHTRGHSAALPYHCGFCTFGSRQEAHLLAHAMVHTPEYQQRTRTIMAQHRTSVTHPPVPGVSLPVDALANKSSNVGLTASEVSRKRPHVASPPPSGSVMPQPPPTSKYMCDQCPASFSKLLTLQYHQSLHGAKNPHHCQRCNYAGKTEDNLKQHQQLHDQHDENLKTGSQAKEAGVKTEKERTTAAVSAAVATNPVAAPETVPKSKSQSGKMEKYKVEHNSKSQKYPKYSKDGSAYHPPIKLKLIGLRPVSSGDSSGGQPQFKYYVEEQVPLSGVDLLRRKTEMEKEGLRNEKEGVVSHKSSSKSKSSKEKNDSEVETDPMRIGDCNLHYPLHIDKVTGKSRQKRYKCNKCPSAFEKTEQYHVHVNLHGSKYKYRCRICDYSVKFYANFMMHINRHKYHEKLVAQKAGTSHPSDSDSKYLPAVDNDESTSVVDSKVADSKVVESKVSKIQKNEDKENVDDRGDLTTTERQHLLLQNKKGIDTQKKDPDREKQVYYCTNCPYANVRRDAVDSHSYRHLANGGYGVYKCTLCDYTASQLNFIKEHTKVHFRPFKYVIPEGFMRHSTHEILSTPVPAPGTRQSDGQRMAEGSLQPPKGRHLVFSHASGVFKPMQVAESGITAADPEPAGGVEVEYSTGDILDAPNEFVIAIRAPKSSKSAHKLPESCDELVSNAAVSGKLPADELTANQCAVESTKLPETAEVPENKIEEPLATSIPIEKEKEEATLINGCHPTSEIPQSMDAQVALNTDEMAVTNGEALAEDEKMDIDVEGLDDHLPKIPIAKAWGAEQQEPLMSSH